jgi:hypothetical protein
MKLSHRHMDFSHSYQRSDVTESIRKKTFERVCAMKGGGEDVERARLVGWELGSVGMSQNLLLVF